MNSFGRIFRVSIFGESHGECVGCLLDGVPAGIEITPEHFKGDLQRRQGGNRAGTTPRKEPDIPIIKSGVFNSRTTGAPLIILFENTAQRSKDYQAIKDTPRPGHSDFVAYKKFGGFNDYRGGGHFSGRLTAALVAAGVIAKKLLAEVEISAKLISAGGSTDIDATVKQALEDGDSVGAVVECRVDNLPVGLGEPFFDSVESVISHAVFAIPAIKGIEFGAGFKLAEMRGSEANDQFLDASGKTSTNFAGGIHGGLSNGNQLVFRVAVKPTSSIKKPQSSIELSSGEQTTISVDGRHDACIGLRVPVVVEAVTAIVLTDLMALSAKLPKVLN